MRLLDHPVISSRYFFPRPDAVSDPAFVESHGERLRCHTHRPHPGAPTVLFFHGNGEVVADYVPWFPEVLAHLGVNSFLAEYRGYGGSSGTPSLGSMLDDVDALVRAAAATPSEIIVFGRSIGSLFALETARRHPSVRGVILESGIADVRERLAIRMTPDELGVTEDAMRAAIDAALDQCAKAAAYPGNILLLHARGDSMVSASHAERVAEAAGSRARLVLLPRGDHNNVMTANEDVYWREVEAFVRAVSQRP